MTDDDRREDTPEAWSTTTKRLVVVGALILAFLILLQARQVVYVALLASLVAYLLNPIVAFLTKHSRLPRTAVMIVVYLVLVAILIAVPVLVTPVLVNEVRSLSENVDEISDALRSLAGMSGNAVIFGFSMDIATIYRQVEASLSSLVSSLASRTVSVVFNVASVLVTFVLVLFLSFYLLKDVDRIMAYLENLVPPSYRHDFRYLRGQINAVWNAFFRGQLILMSIVGVSVGVSLAIVGTPNALLLGIAAGIFEAIPNIGATLGAIPGVAVAFFQGSSYLPLTDLWFTVLVIGIYVVIQQIENNILVPRIMGQSLGLHPLAVLLAVIVGASIAGILGILLAAPVLASVRVLGSYAYGKLLQPEEGGGKPDVDGNPFGEPVEEEHGESLEDSDGKRTG